MWQETAHDLICAANLLVEAEQNVPHESVAENRRPTVWRTLMMLYGLATENLIKAIIVAKNPELKSERTEKRHDLVARPHGPLPGWFRTHDLLSLAKRAGLPIPRTHEHLLKRLQRFVECGKYHVDLREGQDRSTWVSFGSSDSNDALQLLQYLDGELERVSGEFVKAPADVRRIHRDHA